MAEHAITNFGETSDFSPFTRLALVFCCALAVYGCSGSTEPGSTDVQPDSENENTESPSVENADQVIPDPMLPMTSRVDFDITVPAYSSDELQVLVQWGDVQETAMWVADEYWTLSVDFLLDRENELVVTFYDRNGAVTLASYQSTFRTGFNSTDSYQISADQFDSDGWDADGDGISNLDEAILGGDSIQLELRDPYFNSAFTIGTSTFESRVPAERPYYEYLELVPENERPELGDVTQMLTIDIDEMGSGTLDDYRIRHGGSSGDFQISSDLATRTNTGDSVIWEGESTYNSQGEYLSFNASSVEVKSINAQSRSVDGTLLSRANGSFQPVVDVYRYALVGEPITDSALCTPTSGTLLHAEYLDKRDGELLYRWNVNRISKGVDDQLWTVVRTTTETLNLN